jgi:hypothetical protein
MCPTWWKATSGPWWSARWRGRVAGRTSVSHWCLHPGGKRILDAVHKGMGFVNGELQESRAVLQGLWQPLVGHGAVCAEADAGKERSRSKSCLQLPLVQD